MAAVKILFPIMKRKRKNLTTTRFVAVRVKYVSIFIFIVAWILTARGQEQTRTPMNDTSLGRPQEFNSELFLAPPSFLPARSQAIPQESFTDFLHQSISVPLLPLSLRNRTKNDLQNSWKQELVKQEEYRTLRIVLGSIQMGGVAYLTYLHIKKYGLK
jgi:hypothetical protein